MREASDLDGGWRDVTQRTAGTYESPLNEESSVSSDGDDEEEEEVADGKRV